MMGATALVAVPATIYSFSPAANVGVAEAELAAEQQFAANEAVANSEWAMMAIDDYAEGGTIATDYAVQSGAIAAEEVGTAEAEEALLEVLLDLIIL